jgi:hypothetical protein
MLTEYKKCYVRGYIKNKKEGTYSLFTLSVYPLVYLLLESLC